MILGLLTAAEEPILRETFTSRVPAGVPPNKSKTHRD